ncbi:hypothetical protein BCR42DRAFT_429349 [Absidia repens]|uniref:Uncharacterized protein n=1 Tax=Absidia repens TaxID=90262 RepID=A0A1X2HWY3_9FUNG|nr:hypothetical protein BCR42DRAFT_429349 [Absidia repens]
MDFSRHHIPPTPSSSSFRDKLKFNTPVDVTERMLLLLTWLSTHRRAVIFACTLCICFIYLDILPTSDSSHQPGGDVGYNGQMNDLDMDYLPDDPDYHLQEIQATLSSSPHQGPEPMGSIFTKDMFAAPNYQDEEDSLIKPLTVIILRKSSRSGAIEHLVHQILNYPFFKEIFIYNTDSSSPLNKDMFTIPDIDSVKMQIINVSKNDRLNSLSRYTLCASMASYEYCYFQDDDIFDDADQNIVSTQTSTSYYWDTLYVNFLRYPSLIHGNVQSSRFIDHYRWRFHNRELKMHSGYIDLAFGAIVPRWKVQHFLTQLGKSGLGKDRLYEADAYFSIWSNQYPWLLDNPLKTSLPISVSSTGAKIEDMDLSSFLLDPNPHVGDTRRMIYDAARRLHRTLQNDLTPNPKDYVERSEEMPPIHQRDTRSSCANDRCLFITNIDPVSSEQLGMVPIFDKAKYTNPKDWDQALDEHLDLPSNDYWVLHGYHNAVDQRNDTCWMIKPNPRTNDYFGLITLGNGMPSRLVISTTTFTSLPDDPIDELFKISILRNENDWTPCKVVHYSTSNNPVATDISFDLNCSSDNMDIADENNNFKKDPIYDNQHLEKIHTIRVSFLKDLEKPFDVCGLTINSLSV